MLDDIKNKTPQIPLTSGWDDNVHSVYTAADIMDFVSECNRLARLGILFKLSGFVHKLFEATEFTELYGDEITKNYVKTVLSREERIVDNIKSNIETLKDDKKHRSTIVYRMISDVIPYIERLYSITRVRNNVKLCTKLIKHRKDHLIKQLKDYTDSVDTNIRSLQKRLSNAELSLLNTKKQLTEPMLVNQKKAEMGAKMTQKTDAKQKKADVYKLSRTSLKSLKFFEDNKSALVIELCNIIPDIKDNTSADEIDTITMLKKVLSWIQKHRESKIVNEGDKCVVQKILSSVCKWIAEFKQVGPKWKEDLPPRSLIGKHLGMMHHILPKNPKMEEMFHVSGLLLQVRANCGLILDKLDAEYPAGMNTTAHPSIVAAYNSLCYAVRIAMAHTRRVHVDPDKRRKQILDTIFRLQDELPPKDTPAADTKFTIKSDTYSDIHKAVQHYVQKKQDVYKKQLFKKYLNMYGVDISKNTKSFDLTVWSGVLVRDLVGEQRYACMLRSNFMCMLRGISKLATERTSHIKTVGFSGVWIDKFILRPMFASAHDLCECEACRAEGSCFSAGIRHAYEKTSGGWGARVRDALLNDAPSHCVLIHTARILASKYMFRTSKKKGLTYYTKSMN